MTVVRNELTSKPQLTDEQLKRLQQVEQMPESEINTEGLPEVLDWSGARFRNRDNTKQMLDNDISLWLAQQDNETKRQVNNVIRSFMAVCQHHEAAVINKGEQHEHHATASSG